MPTTQVRTWNEFVEAYKSNVGTTSEPHTIEIMADLDCNDNPPTERIATSGATIINGNYHTIWNISTGTVLNNYIFYLSNATSLTWNKVNFNNISRNETSAVFCGYSGSYRMNFNDCTFVGKGPRLFINALLTRCAVTWINGFDTPFSGINANYTWFHLEIKRNLQNANVEFGQLNTCYLEGKIEPGTSSVTSMGNIGSQINNSVINIETPLTITRPTTTQATINNIYNTDKITFTNPYTTDIGVTDAQMHNAAYLASVGFNIVP